MTAPPHPAATQASTAPSVPTANAAPPAAAATAAATAHSNADERPTPAPPVSPRIGPSVAPLVPPFDLEVAPGGYAWWYLDALSDDGAHGLTIIAFIGSVFSPYYARARRRSSSGRVDPADHCALNVVLYERRGGGRWSMTERGATQLHRHATQLRIGPSALTWHGDTLTIEVDEVTMPLPSRLRGTVTLHAPCRFRHAYPLAPGHRWCPIAPMARIEVALGGRHWRGHAYFDSNHGDAPLEDAFERWEWSRTVTAGGDAIVCYDTEPRAGLVGAAPTRLGLRFRPDGTVEPTPALPLQPLPVTGWRVTRHAHVDRGRAARVIRTLTDAPFYARSLIATAWFGEPVTAFHESLSMTRFTRPWVQAMLPFRIPRRRG